MSEPDLVTMAVEVPRDVRRDFRAVTVADGTTMSAVVTALLREYLARRRAEAVRAHTAPLRAEDRAGEGGGPWR